MESGTESSTGSSRKLNTLTGEDQAGRRGSENGAGQGREDSELSRYVRRHDSGTLTRWSVGRPSSGFAKMPLPNRHGLRNLTWLRKSSCCRSCRDDRHNSNSQRSLNEQPGGQNRQQSHQDWHHCLKRNQHRLGTASNTSTRSSKSQKRNSSEQTCAATASSKVLFVPRGYGCRTRRSEKK